MAENRPIIALPDAELESIFLDTEDGKHYRRTKASGEFYAQAITYQLDGIRKTQRTVTDMPKRFPKDGTDPIEKRKAIIIQNLDETNSIYFHTNQVFTTGWTEDSEDGGQRVGPGESFNSPASPDVVFWMATETGKTARTEFTEVR